MIKYGITVISKQEYSDLLKWCRENLDGFEQQNMSGVDGFGAILGAELHFPDEGALVHFMMVWLGQLGDHDIWPA